MKSAVAQYGITLFASLAGATGVALVSSGWWDALIFVTTFAIVVIVLRNPPSADREAGEHNAEENHDSSQIALLTQVIQGVHGELLDSGRDIGQVNRIVGDSINQLQDSFTQLGVQTQQQKVTINQVISSLSDISQEEATKQVGYEEFARETGTVLQYMVEHVIHISKESMQMANTIDDIVEDMDKVVSLLADVKSIADQTNLLALNAAIEAARAGDAGRGFAVVADEVRNLSRSSNVFSEQIRDVVNLARRNIEQAKGTISNMASKDMNVAIQSKEKVDIMLRQVTQLNEKVGHYLENIDSSSESIRHNISVAVRSMQFEDITTQMLSRLGDRISHTGKLVDGLQDVITKILHDGKMDQDVVHRLTALQDILLQTKKPDTKQMQAESVSTLESGDVELF